MSQSRLLSAVLLLALIAPLAAPQPSAPAQVRSPELAIQIGHMVGIHGLAFSPKRPWMELGFPHRAGDGELLAVGANDSILELWDPTSNEQVRTLRFPEGGTISAVAFTSDSKLIAAAGGSLIKIWSVETGRLLHTLHGADRSYHSIDFSPDGSKVAASGAKAVTVWSLSDEKPNSFADAAYNAAAVFISETRIVTVGSSQSSNETQDRNRPYAIRVWDLQSDMKLGEFIGSSPQILSARYTSPNTIVVWGENYCALTHSSCNVVESWNLTSGAHHAMPTTPETATAGAVCPDGSTELAAFNDGVISLSSPMQGADYYKSKQADPKAFLEAAACNYDSTLFAAADMTGRVFLWRNGSPQPIATLAGVIAEVDSIGFASNSHLISGNQGANYAFGYTESLTDWDLLSPRHPEIVLAGLPVSVNTSNGTYAWLTGPGRTINGAQVVVGTAEHNTPTGIAADRGARMDFSKRGDLLAVATDTEGMTWRSKIGVWKAGPFQKLYDLDPSGPSLVERVTFGSDDNTVITTGGDGLTVYDLTTRAPKCVSGQKNAPEHTVWAAAVNHIGSLFAWGGNDDTVTLSDLGDCKPEKAFRHGDSALLALSFSSGDKLLASAFSDGVIDIWNLTSDRHLSLIGHMWDVSSLSFNVSGTILVSGSWDGTTKLWDVETGKELVSLITFADLQNWAAVTPEGLFDASADGIKSLFWRVDDTNELVALDTYYGDYYHPGLISEIYTGGRPKPVVDLASRLRFPSLRVLGEAGLAHLEKQQDDYVLCVSASFSGNVNEAAKIYPRGGEPIFPSVETFSRDDARPDCAYRWLLPRDGAPYALDAPVSDERPKLTDTSKKRLFVFTVGITKYEQDLRYKINGTYPPLPFASADADLVSAVFEKQKGEANKPFNKIIVLPGLRDNNATLSNIRQALDSIGKQALPGDVVLLFFAGHGVVQPGEEMFDFIPYVGRPRDLLTAPILDESKIGFNTAMLADAIRNLNTSNVVVVIDACQAGGALESLQNIAKMERKIYQLRTGARNPKRVESEPGLFLISAAMPIEEAAATDKLQHGILSSVLLDALQGQSIVSAWDVMTAIQREVPIRAAQQGWSQTSLATHVGADFLLVGAATQSQETSVKTHVN